MTKMTLSALSEKMRDIDFTVLTTHSSDGLAARPMSNNRQVDYDGDSYFFTMDDTRTVADIARNPAVGLAYQAKSGLLHMKPFFATIEGKGELIRDKARFAEHWTKDLDAWFKDGIDTPGLVMVRVRADRIHYWDGYDEGEIALASKQALADA